jgi:serine/threonine protein kinase
MLCPSCGFEINSTARFCARCGKPVDVTEPDPLETILGDETTLDANQETLLPDLPPTPRSTPRPTPTPRQVSTPRTPAATPPSNSILASSDPIGGGRFTPGAIVAERYRIVALLGRGGMGEVYRADDLKLSHVVAIKFLPETLSRDASALARFHSEVRVARQVSHPNVCRVFDIGDAEGVPFLTMEYVDGEDLSSLVRRIGRLPQDKATEVSRQICAGLAAAHERGVVHRDLKPSNLMLDGAGKIRITDFGLAGIAATMQGAELRAGTPAYMAPEQLTGKEVTTKSDIYSLGLVMYEILTGKRAFDATTLPELMKAREDGALTRPSTIVRDLDPLVERVILRCIERDPAKRPTSALQVAAALPGGDPLAAALAAGETPSPEMVAAAGEKEGLNPRIGLFCLAALVVMLGALLFVAKRAKMAALLPFGDSPEVLSSKARDMVTRLGYTSAPIDTAWGFVLDNNDLQHIQSNDKSTTRWNVLREIDPPAMIFWYRQSPRLLTSFSPADNLIFGRVQLDEPPLEISDSRLIELNLKGDLVQFRAVPPQVEDPSPTAPVAPDWAALFAAANLDPARFHAVEPRWYPLAWGNTRGGMGRQCAGPWRHSTPH